MTGHGSRPRPPTRPRPGARDRGSPEQTAGPAESREAREQQLPRAGEKLRFPGPGRREKWSRGEPCTGTPRARWSRAHLAGQPRVRITERPVAAVLAFGLRSPGGGCGCAFTVFTCRPGTSDWEQHPRSRPLVEGAGAAAF